MAKGKKTDNETIYKVMLSVFSTGNYSETARQLNIPVGTVEDIYKRNIEKEEFAKLRKEKAEEFTEKASKIIDKALEENALQVEVYSREGDLVEGLPVGRANNYKNG